MCKVFKCHVCEPCWQAHAALHNKPVTNALSHWVLYVFTAAFCGLVFPCQQRMERSTDPCTHQEWFFWFWFAKGRVLPQSAVSRAAAPHTEHPGKFVPCPIVWAPKCLSPRPFCPVCLASSRARAAYPLQQRGQSQGGPLALPGVALESHSPMGRPHMPESSVTASRDLVSSRNPHRSPPLGEEIHPSMLPHPSLPAGNQEGPPCPGLPILLFLWSMRGWDACA